MKTTALCTGAAALAVMGALTLQARLSEAPSGPSTTFVANFSSPGPVTTPTVASAVPAVKATTFVGGDWPGMPSGH